MSSQRHFKNPYPDYDGHSLISEDKTLRPKYKQLIESNIVRLFEYWEKNHQNHPSNDTTIYTGSIGWAVLYIKVYESKILPDSEKYLLKAYEIVEKELKHYDKIKLPTYLCGEVGLLTTAIVVYHYLNKDYKKFLQDLISFQPQIYKIDSDELLYGRIGYLYSFLYLRWKIPETASMIHDEFIRGIVAIILNSGAQTSAQQKSIYPLTYYWYRDPYVGAAHGYLGIIYFLLHSIKFITEDELNRLIRPTIDLILNLQFKNGNFPPCIGEREDLLVHWCHGAPGAIYLFIKAYEIFKEPRYLEAAKSAAETIWKRGLLIKGYGLCHGASGNAYSFNQLYLGTKDPKYLYRALKFAEWCCDFGKHKCRTPDTPFSLFEGLAGTLYFLLDILSPENAKFPGFQLE